MGGSGSGSDPDRDLITQHIGHFGVKGMHWGQRKDPDRPSARTSKKFEKKATSRKTLFAIHNAAARRMNTTEIPRINNKPQYRDKDFTHDSPLRRKYYQEYSDTFARAMREEALKQVGPGPDASKRVSFTYDNDTAELRFHWDDIQHAADGDIVLVAKTNAKGYITSFDAVDGAMAHFGVKGMHWGQRKAVTREPAHGDARRAVRVTERARMSGAAAISNRDLQHAINRLNLEQQFDRVRPKTTSEQTKAWIAHTLLGIGKEQVSAAARNFATEQVKSALKK